MDQKELAELEARAEAALKQIPGVVGVGFGLRERGGRTTEERALRVYVRHKRPLSEIPDDEVIPSEFEGVPVDVLRLLTVERDHCKDMVQHHPLIGGISITNFKSNNAGEVGSGTLGFFATLDGVSGPKNVVLVSNNHVLTSNGAGAGAAIYQPLYREQGGSVNLVDSPESRRAIAKIHDVGVDGPHNFAYPGEAADDYSLDCASAKLNISISSWCNSNCGVSYKNEIRGLNIGGNSKIEGVARVTQSDIDAPGDYAVFKVGRSTSKTSGRVIEHAGNAQDGDGQVVSNVIIVEPLGPDCDGIEQFSASGDSGAALVNDQNQIIGVHFGSGERDDGTRLAFSCHIHPVMDRLAITPISTQNPPVGPAGQARDDRLAVLTDGEDRTLDLRDRFVATRRGRELYRAFVAHGEEIVGLVNHHRPATVAWHRGKGPAFLAHLAENARRPEHRIPFEVEGVGRRELLQRMDDALAAAGSAPLRAVIDRHRDEVLALVDTFDDLHELAGRFDDSSVDA